MTDSTDSHRTTSSDLLVIGAGPTGLACAIEAQRAGFSARPGRQGLPLQLPLPLPRAHDLLHHAGAARDRRHALLQPQPEAHPQRGARVLPQGRRALSASTSASTRPSTRVTGSDGDFTVHTTDRFGRTLQHRARKLVIATGYYDLPNYLDIPGEDLAKVKHYYHEPHPYYGLDVLVIGGKNSAAIAALDLWRHGARVTLVHRGAEMHRHVKYWILPDINNRIKNDEITAYFNSTVTQITEDTVTLATPARHRSLSPTNFVFALTGYHPDFAFIERLGVKLDAANDRRPVCDPATLESNVPGIYLAGVIVAGERTNEIFIENGRFHGTLIARSRRCQSSRQEHRNQRPHPRRSAPHRSASSQSGVALHLSKNTALSRSPAAKIP